MIWLRPDDAGHAWPLIQQDPHAFVQRVGSLAEVRVLEPGQSYDF